MLAWSPRQSFLQHSNFSPSERSMSSLKLSCLFMLALVGGLAAHATPITYSDTDTASGTLGGVSFTNQNVTVSFTGDTGNVTNAGGIFNSIGVGSITIGSAGPVLFTDSIEFFDNQPQGAAGIGDATLDASILDTFASAFDTYGGTTAIGPTSGPVFFIAGVNYNTAAGALDFSTAGADSTFTATLGSPSPVPEPCTFALLGTGIVCLAGAARRKLNLA
jgi:hypothetical protein